MWVTEERNRLWLGSSGNASCHPQDTLSEAEAWKALGFLTNQLRSGQRDIQANHQGTETLGQGLGSDPKASLARSFRAPSRLPQQTKAAGSLLKQWVRRVDSESQPVIGKRQNELEAVEENNEDPIACVGRSCKLGWTREEGAAPRQAGKTLRCTV
jgi:hypothetical protein